MLNIEKNLKVKVLVLGDSGVGKSSFTHLLCHNQANRNPAYTIGCSVEIQACIGFLTIESLSGYPHFVNVSSLEKNKLHDYKQGTAEEKTFCVEVWDLGASKSHTSSRFIFYNNVNGIILVHDLTNYKSLQNLNKWLNDVLSQESTGGLSSVKVGSSATNNFSDENAPSSTPILMVGTKLDLLPENKRTTTITRSKYFAEEIGCIDVYLDNIEPKYVAAGSGNAVQLSRFFDKVIEHTLTKRITTTSTQSPVVIDRKGSVSERRRQNSTQVGRLLGFKSE